jgi:hypothetical protein
VVEVAKVMKRTEAAVRQKAKTILALVWVIAVEDSHYDGLSREGRVARDERRHHFRSSSALQVRWGCQKQSLRCTAAAISWRCRSVILSHGQTLIWSKRHGQSGPVTDACPTSAGNRSNGAEDLRAISSTAQSFLR